MTSPDEAEQALALYGELRKGDVMTVWIVYDGVEIEGVATERVHSVWLREEAAKACSENLEEKYKDSKTKWSNYEEFDVEDAEG